MKVLLVGGPFDGQERELDPARKLLTIEWTENVQSHGWEGIEVEVHRLGFATYERHPDGTFHYAPGHPAEAGDEGRWDQQPLPFNEKEGPRFA